MRATLRLVWTYFTATRLMRGLSLIGCALILSGAVGHLFVGRDVMQLAIRGQFQGVFPFYVYALPWLGLILLLSAAALMPAIVEQIATRRAIWVLPGGRLRLLLSVVITVALLALLVAIESSILIYDALGAPASMLPSLFRRTLAMAFIDLAIVYTATWLVSKTQGVWRMAGVLGAICSIAVPLRLLGEVRQFSLFEVFGVAGWVLFAVVLLAGGRARHSFSGMKRSLAGIAERLSPKVQYKTGREFDLMLGASHPWLIAFGQIIPIAAMALLIRYRDGWLPVLLVFSAMAGAVTSQAAARSRRFWLHINLDRREIARRVELVFWRFNSSALLVLFVVYAALAFYASFSVPQVLHGWAILALGCACCTYLGLMITRGLGWVESVLCIMTLSVMTVAAVATMRNNFVLAGELELLLGILAIAFRYAALSRWATLDWMRCRSETPVRGASA